MPGKAKDGQIKNQLCEGKLRTIQKLHSTNTDKTEENIWKKYDVCGIPIFKKENNNIIIMKKKMHIK